MDLIFRILTDFCVSAIIACLAAMCFGIHLTLFQAIGIWLILKLINLNIPTNTK